LGKGKNEREIKEKKKIKKRPEKRELFFFFS
jgi:hypothetical protein